MAVRAREVELPLALEVELAAVLVGRRGRAVDAHRERHAARLMRDVRGEAEELLRLPGQCRVALLAHDARVDALLEIDHFTEGGIVSGITGRDTLHRLRRVAVARRAA